MRDTHTGTLTYMSPERIAGDHYGYASDVWALGLCLIAVAQGRSPLPAHLGYWAVVRAIQDDAPPALHANDGWSPLLVDFVAKCLARDPRERWLPKQLHSHPFLARRRDGREPLPPSPPSKPTPGLLAHLNELAAAAAQWHLALGSPRATTEEPLNISGALPPLDPSRLAALAEQLNLPADCVSCAFHEAWAAAEAADEPGSDKEIAANEESEGDWDDGEALGEASGLSYE